jgi:hypothetical protein
MCDKAVRRPIPWEASNHDLKTDITPYKAWKWVSSLFLIKKDLKYSIFIRNATLLLDDSSKKSGAWHPFADGQVFTRIYIVPTNKCKELNELPKLKSPAGMSCGKWNDDKSSFFLFKDVKKLF